MIARVVITTYLTLVPPKTLIYTYFCFTAIQFLGYEMIALGHYLPNLSTALFHLGMFVFGIGRGIFAFPYLIFVRTFNQPSDALLILFWLALGMFGNNWGIFLVTLMENNFGWSWYFALSIFSFISLMGALLAYKTLPEEYLPESEHM